VERRPTTAAGHTPLIGLVERSVRADYASESAIGDYRAAYVSADHPLLLPRENRRPLDRHTITRLIDKAGAAAGLPHIHPHQLRHTLATQAINHGMTLEAIAAAVAGAHRADGQVR
jgi:site-specific recombinase XerD